MQKCVLDFSYLFAAKSRMTKVGEEGGKKKKQIFFLKKNKRQKEIEERMKIEVGI